MADLDLETERELLQDEQNKWEQLHLPPPKVVFNVDEFYQGCRVDALCQLLVELDLLSAEDFQAAIFRNIRQRMETARPDLVRQMRELKIGPHNGTKLFGADGRPLL